MEELGQVTTAPQTPRATLTLSSQPRREVAQTEPRVQAFPCAAGQTISLGATRRVQAKLRPQVASRRPVMVTQSGPTTAKQGPKLTRILAVEFRYGRGQTRAAPL